MVFIHHSAVAQLMTGDQDNTLQDVHPDQLRSLRTAADLVLEKILRLQRSRGAEERQGSLFLFTSTLQQCWRTFIFKLDASPSPAPNSESARGTPLGSSELHNYNINNLHIWTNVCSVLCFCSIIGGVPYVA